MGDPGPRWLYIAVAITALAGSAVSVIYNYAQLDQNKQVTQDKLSDVKQRVSALESDRELKDAVKSLSKDVALLQWQVGEMTTELRELKRRR